jgi:O-antigen/teichoic acid export membrane protein
MFRPLMPKISELRAAGGKSVSRGFRKASAWIFYALLPVATGLALLAQPLVITYAGPAYAEAGFILTLLAAGQFLYALYSLYATHVFVLESPGRPLLLETVSGAVSLATAFICIRIWENVGAAIVPIVTFSLGTVIARQLLSRRGDYGLPVQAISAASLASAMMAALVYVVVAVTDGHPMVLATIPLFALLYVAMVTYLMPDADRSELASALSPRANAVRRIVERMRPKETS